MQHPSDSTTSGSNPSGVLLDYAAPTLRRPIILRAWSAVWWFAVHRKLSDTEIAISCWVCWATSYFFLALHGSEDLADASKPFFVATFILPTLSLFAIRRLLAGHHLRQFTFSILIVAATLSFTGMIQFDQCPHATYLQLLGNSFAISGHACSNPRKTLPWWMR